MHFRVSAKSPTSRKKREKWGTRRKMGHPALHKQQTWGHPPAGNDSWILRPAKDAGLRMTKQYSRSYQRRGLNGPAAGVAACLRHFSIRLGEPAWDPYWRRGWPVVQKLPAPAAALRWQRVQALQDQTGSLQTERNAANGMRPPRQANPIRNQPRQAWRRNSG